MRVLVTGGAGFVGSTLIPQLLSCGHEVTVLDNLTWGSRGLSVDLENPYFRLIEGDIRDEKLVKHLMSRTDVVVHLAALVGCGLCDQNKQEADDVNVNGSKIIDSYLTNEQLLVYASTGSVYGPINPPYFTEETAPNPQTQYAKTKYQAERVFAKRKNAVVLRFATAFGVSYRMRLDLLVNQFVYEAITQKVLHVYGKDSVRSVVHVRDIARSIMFAISNREAMQGKIFNVSASVLSFTKEEIARHIQRQVSCQLEYTDSVYTDGRDYQVSTQKIESLGYRTSTTLDEGISELVSAVKEAPIDKTCFNIQPGLHG